MLKVPVSDEIKIKGSRFIGHAGPVCDENEARSFLDRLVKQYYDATHHCYAYRVGTGNRSLFRYSDAGEPTGTAGKPILNTIDGRSLSNVICVVVRYFGGVKLGMGGLARAYAACAKRTLEKAPVKSCCETQICRLQFDYDFTGSVMHVISSYRAEILESDYGSQSALILRIPKSKTLDFEKQLMNETSGRTKISWEEVKDR
jgi:uncharacterized YigZ family protein